MAKKIVQCIWNEEHREEYLKRAITWLLCQRPWLAVFLVNITKNGMTIVESPLKEDVLKRKLSSPSVDDRNSILNELSRNRKVTILWTFQKPVRLAEEEAELYENVVRRKLSNGELEIEDISCKSMITRLKTICTNACHLVSEREWTSGKTLDRMEASYLPVVSVYRTEDTSYSLPNFPSSNGNVNAICVRERNLSSFPPASCPAEKLYNCVSNGSFMQGPARQLENNLCSLCQHEERPLPRCQKCKNVTTDLVLLPCGHFSCDPCVQNLSKCQNCQNSIEDKIKPWLATRSEFLCLGE